MPSSASTLGERGFDGRLVADVGGDAQDPLVGRRLEVERSDLRAVAGKDLRDALADATARPRDDGDAAAEPFHLDHPEPPMRPAGRGCSFVW